MIKMKDDHAEKKRNKYLSELKLKAEIHNKEQ